MLKLADSIKTSNSLSIGIEYADSESTKTTTITIPNFKDDLTEEQIKNAFNNQNVIIYGYDEQGEAQPVQSDNILTASTTHQTINNLDIGWED